MAIPTFVGCFSTSQPLSPQGYAKYQSSGHCNDICTGNDRLVLGLSNGTQCWCGNELPRANSQVQRSNCDTPCQGYDLEDCGGGNNFFTIWLTELGTESDKPVPNYKGSTATSSNNNSPASTKTSSNRRTTSSTRTRNNDSPPTSTSTSTASSGSPQQTRPGQPASGSDATENNLSKGHNDETVAIAVGVVIGVVALALMFFIFWLTWRRRKRTGTFARYEDSVDGSSAALQPRQMAQSGSASGLTALPDMSQAKYAPGPAIMVHQPTAPATPAGSRSLTGAAAPAALVAPAVIAPREDTLRPPAAPRELSHASSTTDPFYTPLEQPSISHLNQSELNALKAQSRQDSISSESAYEDEEGSDTLSPLESVRAPERKNSRNLLYPSSGEADAFDFAGPGTSPLPGTVPGYFPVSHDYRDGRESFRREELP